MKQFLIFLALLGMSGFSFAETYHGSFVIDGRGGSGKASIVFVYNLNLANKQNITGDVTVTGGRGNCNRDYKLASGFIKGENVVLTSDSLEGHCGPFIFKGKLDGNDLVGTIPYGGQPREIILRLN